MNVSPSHAGPVFRVDKFKVPEAAMAAFSGRLHLIQRALDEQAGCGQNLVLRQTGGPGEFNVVTIVEWASAEAMATAQARMQQRYADEGFDPKAFMQRHGIQADLALYGSMAPAGDATARAA